MWSQTPGWTAGSDSKGSHLPRWNKEPPQASHPQLPTWSEIATNRKTTLNSAGAFPGSSSGVWPGECWCFSVKPILGELWGFYPRSQQAYSDEDEQVRFSFRVASTRWHGPSMGQGDRQLSSGSKGRAKPEASQRKRRSRLHALVGYEVHVLGQPIFILVNLEGFGTHKLHKDRQIIIHWKPIRFFVSLIIAFLFEKDFHKRGQLHPQN